MATYEKALEALADGTRRRVFELLRSGPCSVSDLAAALPVSRPAVSQHLRVLKAAGLVQERPSGTLRIYSIRRAGLQALRSYVDGFWDDVLAAFKEEVEGAAEKSPRRRNKP